MSTFRIKMSTNGESFGPCPVAGVFTDEEEATTAARLLSEMNPSSVYEVEKSRRGRPAGTRDSKPRIRRTKAQIEGIEEVYAQVDEVNRDLEEEIEREVFDHSDHDEDVAPDSRAA